MAQKLLTVAQAAARLQCHPHTIRRWIWDRKLRAVKAGDLVRIPEEELSHLMRPTGDRRRARSARVKGGARQLIATIRRLRKKVDPADVKLLERKIAEADQPADWRNSID